MTLPACCLDMDIAVFDLMRPDRMSGDGLEFVAAHGITVMGLEDRWGLLKDAVEMGGGIVKIKHRCAQLGDDGRCRIYATRPAICRNFDCMTRHDCACRGQGLVAVGEVTYET